MPHEIQSEAILLREAAEALRRIGFVRDVELVPPRKPGSGHKWKLKGPWGTAAFQIDVQPRLLESALPAAAHRRHSEPDRRLLIVTSYVPTALAEKLRAHGIEFLDAAGNAYLNRPVYLFVSGRKRTHKSMQINRAFRPAGLRLLYVLLKNPNFLAKTQRELARAADIALGSLPVILQDLRGRGYLQRMGGGSQALANTRELLFRWEQGYGELLCPKLYIQTCRLAGANIKMEDLLPRLKHRPTILLGGELGAATLTKHLRAETATLHITEDEKAVMASLKLVPDPHGGITLLKTFGTENASQERLNELVLADPLLIHAELARLSGDRIQEIGKILLEAHILPRLA
jgi:hypothetical protein